MRKLVLLTVAMLVAVPLAAYAETDCSGASQFNHNRSFRNGERAWTQDNSGNYHVYSCEKDKCSESPGVDGSGWKSLGSRVAGSGAGACH